MSSIEPDPVQPDPALVDPALVDAARGARRVAVLSGAGMSAESGISTFRDAQAGLWERFDPTELATPQAWARDSDWCGPGTSGAPRRYGSSSRAPGTGRWRAGPAPST